MAPQTRVGPTRGAHPSLLCLCLSALSLCVLSCSVHLPQQHGVVYHTPREVSAIKRKSRMLTRGRSLESVFPSFTSRRRLVPSTEWAISSDGKDHMEPSIPPCNATVAALSPENRQALVDLSTGLHIAAWNVSTVQAACQTWPGVCCNEKGQVTSLATAGLNASGVILQSITQLTAATAVRLEQVKLNKTVPPYLGAMTQLQLLSFMDTSSKTEFFQDLIWLETLTALTLLSLSNTGLRGFMPDQLLSLKQLVFLDVSRNSLDVFPCWISQFRSLQKLEAYEANIYGTIPLELAYMPSLTHLDLASNQLFGDLHAGLFNLTNLRFFDVSNNFLEAPVPPQVGQMVNLTNLDFRNNSLTGAIPSTLNNLTSLVNLQLADNFFVDPLPAISGMVSLKLLNLSHNSFNGPLPLTSIAAATGLEYLSLSDNNFTGETPPPFQVSFIKNLFPSLKGMWFNNMKSKGPIDIFAQTPTLRYLGLSNNLFNGTFPTAFSRLTNLVELDVSMNNITGPFPAFLLNISTLTTIDIRSNSFFGPIPPGSMAKWPSTELLLGNNFFSGELPPEISTLTRLEVFDVGFNQFSGPADLTALLGGMRNATIINLNNNLFSGPWPGFTNHSSLLALNLANNSFSGPIPTSWRTLVSLTGLFVSSNGGFQGSSVPTGLKILTKLQALFSDSNQLGGQLPEVFAGLRNLQYMSFANNRLAGTIPSSLCSLDTLKFLNLANNTLSGAIASCFYLSPQMKVLDLSNNYLSGTLEGQFISFDISGKGVMDLSNNYIYGSPPAFFNTTEIACNSNSGGDISRERVVSIPGVTMVYQKASSLSGNCFDIPDSTPCLVKELVGTTRSSAECLAHCSTTGQNQCGGYGSCTPTVTPEGAYTTEFYCTCQEGFQTVPGPTGGSNCGVVTSSLSAGAIAGIVVGCLCAVAAVILLWVYMEQRRKWQANQRWKDLDVCTQYTLSRVQKATHDWAQENIIGEGSYGMVYKGYPGSTSSSGVKEEWAVKRAKLMTNEFESEVRAMASLHHKNLVRLIGFCADYNSSTGVQEQILIYEFCVNGDLGLHLYDRRKIAPLTLDTRLHVAIGAAEGIAYLHSFDPPVIHRDIKPENILLNEVFDAKVADFGLAKKMESVVQATKVAGTPGYVDPEYNKTRVVSTKTDVYSFGIVLLEMITGRHPMVRVSKDENEPLVHIVQWVRPRFEEWDGDALADPVLLVPPEAILELTLLAIDCVRCPAMARPDMRDIVTRLQGIRTKYEGLLNDVVFVKDFGNSGGDGGSSGNGSGYVGPVRVGSAGQVNGSGRGSVGSLKGSQLNAIGVPGAEDQENLVHGVNTYQHPVPGQPGIGVGGLMQGDSLIEHYDSGDHSAMQSITVRDPEEDYLTQKFEMVHTAARNQMEDNSNHGLNIPREV